MECNREEALRSKEIAEKKLAVQDYASASKFAYKAQQLYPGLENLVQMLAVIDVHVAAQTKLNGNELDWYKILQVESTADEVLIKKQYKKLALLLHPDKNKFAGAEAAFKLIGEASQILSDKAKRIMHDTKRKVASNRGMQNVNISQDVHMSFSNGQYRGMASQSVNIASGPFPRMPSMPQTSTFWTACPSCQMRYQYLRTYENQNLLCPNCRQSFMAKDLNSMQGNAAAATHSWSQHFGPQQQHFFRPGFNYFNGFPPGTKINDFPSNPGYSSGFATTIPSTGAKTTEEYIQHLYDKVKQDRDKSQNEWEQRRERKEELPQTQVKVKQTEIEREQKRKRREEEQKERELKRLEKQQLKKAKNDERMQEAMERLVAKKREQAEKAGHKDRKKRLRKNTSEGCSDDDDTEEDETLKDILLDGQVMTNNTGTLRRSSRTRRNVIYTVDSDNDDDNDLEAFPASKKGRAEVEADEKKSDDDISLRTASEIGVKSIDVASKLEVNDGAECITKKLADFAKNAIREKLNLQSVKSCSKAEHVSPLINRQEENEEKPIESVAGSTEEKVTPLQKRGQNKTTESVFEEKVPATENIDEPAEPETESYSVPDADFHNFDKGREEKDIKAGQIWALYDELDGMPRYYIRVRDVSFQNHFKVTVTWLELRNPSPDQVKLLESDFACASGDFKMTKSQVMDSVNTFSHIVKWEKGLKGSIRIYPRKADVWSLHCDWEPFQKIINIDNACFKYNIVEVLIDYDEHTGCIVKPLVKVNGFKSLFQQSEESALVIPSEELLRFSHQVPAYKLTGDEAPGVPQGCWELDPASIPLDLIFLGRI